MRRRTKQDDYQKYNCESCGKLLSPEETRLFLEGRYKIDPTGDERQLCSLCKEETNGQK